MSNETKNVLVQEITAEKARVLWGKNNSTRFIFWDEYHLTVSEDELDDIIKKEDGTKRFTMKYCMDCGDCASKEYKHIGVEYVEQPVTQFPLDIKAVNIGDILIEKYDKSHEAMVVEIIFIEQSTKYLYKVGHGHSYIDNNQLFNMYLHKEEEALIGSKDNTPANIVKMEVRRMD